MSQYRNEPNWSSQGPMKPLQALISPPPTFGSMGGGGDGVHSAPATATLLSPTRSQPDMSTLNRTLRLPIVPFVHNPISMPSAAFNAFTADQSPKPAAVQNQAAVNNYAMTLLSPSSLMASTNGGNTAAPNMFVNNINNNCGGGLLTTVSPMQRRPMPMVGNGSGAFSPTYANNQQQHLLPLPSMWSTQPVSMPQLKSPPIIELAAPPPSSVIMDQSLLVCANKNATAAPPALMSVTTSPHSVNVNGDVTSTTTAGAAQQEQQQQLHDVMVKRDENNKKNDSPDTTNSPGTLTIVQNEDQQPIPLKSGNDETTMKPSPGPQSTPLQQMCGSVHRAPGMQPATASHASSMTVPPLVALSTTTSIVTAVATTTSSASSNAATQPATSVTPNGTNVYACQVCGFSSNSKFHFNSHMNTHTDHQCTMCDYTSRTEGRLKRHMKVFHSREEQVEAGMSPMADTPPPPNMIMSQHMTIKHEPNMSLSSVSSALAHMHALTGVGGDGMSTLATSLTDVASAALTATQQDGSPVHHTLNTGRMSTNESTPSGSTPPRRHSSKPKTYTCKQCGIMHMSKEEHWAHARTHIPLEKQLTCPKCDFVTEYKHHLEYHLRNHFNSKPFECVKCKYTCVNKSMLNSHMKSHSNYYQYRCMDCTYATKYCHSLKLHLRKYAHKPSTVISPDGTSIDPNTFEVINHRTGKKGNGRSHSNSRTPPGGGSGGQASAGGGGGGTTPSLQGGGGGTGSGSNSVGPLSMPHTPSVGLDGLHPLNGPRPSPLPAGIANLLAQQRTPFEAAALIQRMINLGIPLPPQLRHANSLCTPPPQQPGQQQQQQRGQLSLSTSGLSSAFAPPSSMPPNLLATGPSDQPITCPICRQECAGRADLLKHHLQTHAVDLGQLQAINLQRFQQVVAATTQAAAMHQSMLQQQQRDAHHMEQQQNGGKQETSGSGGGEHQQANNNASPVGDGDSPLIDVDNVAPYSPTSKKNSPSDSDEPTTGASAASSSAAPLLLPLPLSSRKRKGQAFKLDQISKRLQQGNGNGGTGSSSTGGADSQSPSSGDGRESPHLSESTSKPLTNGRTADSSPSSAASAGRAAAGGGGGNGGNLGGAQTPAAYLAALMQQQQQRHANSTPSMERSSLNALATLAMHHQQQHAQQAAAAAAVAAAHHQHQQHQPYTFVCDHCRIAFADQVMYHIHMGYHGYNDPFKCNRCGHTSTDALAHNLHLMQAKHE